MRLFIWIGIAGSIAISMLAAFARVQTYRVAPLLLIPLLWLPVVFRRRLRLHPAHYAMLCAALLSHMLGALGFYQHSPLPFSWDIFVHYFFAVAAALAVRRLLVDVLDLPHIAVDVLTIFIIMGGGALHEIMEYCSYLLLGEEKGMLKPSTSYFFDTQRDLTNNLLGVITALIVARLARRLFRHRRPSVISSPTQARS